MITRRTCKNDAPAGLSAAGAFPVIIEEAKSLVFRLAVLSVAALMCVFSLSVLA